MSKLLMITGIGSGTDLASGKKGAFYNMLEEFHKHWERIDIVVPEVAGHKPGEIVLFGNVHIHISSWPLILHPIFFLKKSVELHNKVNFDVMSVQEFPPFYNGIGARILHSITGVPYMLEIHHIVGLPKAADIKERFYRGLSRWFLAWDAHGARAVRVVNNSQAPQFLKYAGIPSWKIQYIPSAYIDSSIFYPQPEVVKDHDVVFAGRLEANKNVINLIKAIESIKTAKPDISLLIIGSGPLRGEFEHYVASHDLARNITFSGWLETSSDVARAYQRAKVFVNPSLNEGGPRVALEAMACGMPVITTRVGIMPDIIHDGENGLFCGWDPASIASAIQRMLGDEGLRNRCASNGPIEAGRFERTKAIADYAAAIKKIIGKQLLIIAQKVDENDDLLGFFVGWIKEFAEHFGKVFIIALEAGEYKLPANAAVFSLGKEKKRNRLSRAWNFYKFLFRLVPETDGIFAHMSPIFAVAAWPVAAIYGKRVVLWYLHRSATWRLCLANFLSYKIVTASASSLNLKSSKIIEVGHGIDVGTFKTERDWSWPGDNVVKILSVGRISPIKNYETLINAAAVLRQRGLKFKITIVGRPMMPRDHKYLADLKEMVRNLGLRTEEIEFSGFAPYSEVAQYYKDSDICINLAPRGGLDKAVLEAMASGCLVLTSNEIFSGLFNGYSDKLIFKHGDSEELAGKILKLVSGSEDERKELSDFMANAVAEHHNLSRTIAKISSLFNND